LSLLLDALKEAESHRGSAGKTDTEIPVAETPIDDISSEDDSSDIKMELHIDESVFLEKGGDDKDLKSYALVESESETNKSDSGGLSSGVKDNDIEDKPSDVSGLADIKLPGQGLDTKVLDAEVLSAEVLDSKALDTKKDNKIQSHSSDELLTVDSGQGAVQFPPASAKVIFRNKKIKKQKNFYKMAVYLFIALMLLSISTLYFLTTPSFLSEGNQYLRVFKGFVGVGENLDPVQISMVRKELAGAERLNQSLVVQETAETSVSKSTSDMTITAEGSLTIPLPDKPNTAALSGGNQQTIDNVIKNVKVAETSANETAPNTTLDTALKENTENKDSKTVLPVDSIRISKKRIPNKINQALLLAKNAMASGDWGGAEIAYGEVLAAAPRNLRALLGMAGVKGVNGENSAARTLYKKALLVSPNNIKALAGLLNSRGDQDSAGYRVELNQLLASHPKHAFLHANMGDYYINRQEWPAAQTAYFDAFSRSPLNADYAFNLAVCLDHMGKVKLAKQYYGKALALKKNYGSRFDAAAASRRLQALGVRGSGQ